MNQKGTDHAEEREGSLRTPSRREFLKFAGVGSAAFFLPSIITACNEGPVPVSGSAKLNVSNDTGLLNYAYLSAHFQYEFYRYVTYAPYIGARSLEVLNPVSGAFARMQTHAQTQRSVFRNTIMQGRIPDVIQFEFPDVNFTSRTSVFGFAQTMEDMGVQAFCTLISMCRSADTVSILSKIASVEARHSAVVRDLADIEAGRSDTADRLSFASDAIIPAATGLEMARPLQEYLDLIQRCTPTRLTLVGA